MKKYVLIILAIILGASIIIGTLLFSAITVMNEIIFKPVKEIVEQEEKDKNLSKDNAINYFKEKYNITPKVIEIEKLTTGGGGSPVPSFPKKLEISEVTVEVDGNTYQVVVSNVEESTEGYDNYEYPQIIKYIGNEFYSFFNEKPYDFDLTIKLQGDFLTTSEVKFNKSNCLNCLPYNVHYENNLASVIKSIKINAVIPTPFDNYDKNLELLNLINSTFLSNSIPKTIPKSLNIVFANKFEKYDNCFESTSSDKVQYTINNSKVDGYGEIAYNMASFVSVNTIETDEYIVKGLNLTKDSFTFTKNEKFEVDSKYKVISDFYTFTINQEKYSTVADFAIQLKKTPTLSEDKKYHVIYQSVPSDSSKKPIENKKNLRHKIMDPIHKTESCTKIIAVIVEEE